MSACFRHPSCRPAFGPLHRFVRYPETVD
jgi:hypothetical protein